MAKSAEGDLNRSAKLLGVSVDDLKEALVSRVMQATKGGVKGTVIKYVPPSLQQTGPGLQRIRIKLCSPFSTCNIHFMSNRNVF